MTARCVSLTTYPIQGVFSLGGLGDPDLTWVPLPHPSHPGPSWRGGGYPDLTGSGGGGTPFRSGYPLSWSWLGGGGTLTWMGYPFPRKDLGPEAGKGSGIRDWDTPPPCGWTNKVKTLPSLVLRTRAVKMKMCKVCGNIKISQIGWNSMYYFINF